MCIVRLSLGVGNDTVYGVDCCLQWAQRIDVAQRTDLAGGKKTKSEAKLTFDSYRLKSGSVHVSTDERRT